MLIAQISDMHINERGTAGIGGADAIGNLEACVARLGALDPSPDVILATGDLVKEGTPGEYATLREILEPLRSPLYVIPGNHDIREAMSEAFADAAYLPAGGALMNYTIEDYPVRLLALDTVVPGALHGLLDAGRLAWLEARLGEAPERPSLVFLHHPPFKVGIKMMDGMRCSGGAALGAILAGNPQVERLVCGHVHRAVHVRFHGTAASVCPSTAAQLAVDLSGEVDLRAIWSDEPPAFMLHLWQPGAGLASHVVQL
jgi:3',5'-cyclic AMP phosphodiesterase CpdA